MEKVLTLKQWHRSKLTPPMKLEIYKQLKAGERQKVLAIDHNVSIKLISAINKGNL